AVEGAAGFGGAARGAVGIEPACYCGRARDCGDEQETGGRDRAQCVSRGSFLPVERDSLLCAGAARAGGGYSDFGGAFSGGFLPGIWEEGEGVQPDGTGRAVALSLAGQRARAEKSGGAVSDCMSFAAD